MKANGKMPQDITEYVNLKSPILKYLMEIEKKYWQSEINQTYKFPSRNGYGPGIENDDSTGSLYSLEGKTAYPLASQNRERTIKVAKEISAKVIFGHLSKTKNGQSSGVESRDHQQGFKSQPRGEGPSTSNIPRPLPNRPREQRVPKKIDSLVEELTAPTRLAGENSHGIDSKSINGIRSHKGLRAETKEKSNHSTSALWSANNKPKLNLKAIGIENKEGSLKYLFTAAEKSTDGLKNIRVNGELSAGVSERHPLSPKPLHVARIQMATSANKMAGSTGFLKGETSGMSSKISPKPKNHDLTSKNQFTIGGINISSLLKGRVLTGAGSGIKQIPSNTSHEQHNVKSVRYTPLSSLTQSNYLLVGHKLNVEPKRPEGNSATTFSTTKSKLISAETAKLLGLKDTHLLTLKNHLINPSLASARGGQASPKPTTFDNPTSSKLFASIKSRLNNKPPGSTIPN
jgi:hypothetical protein